MVNIDAKLTASAAHAPTPFQRFALNEQPEHILLSFVDDSVDFGFLRPNITRALESLVRNPALDLEALTRTGTLRDTIGRAKKPSEALVKVEVTVYGPRASAQATGEHLSRHKLWLQRPSQLRPGVVYENPQLISFPGLEYSEAEVLQPVGKGAPGRKAARGERLQSLVAGAFRSTRRAQGLRRVPGGPRVTGHLLELVFLFLSCLEYTLMTALGIKRRHRSLCGSASRATGRTSIACGAPRWSTASNCITPSPNICSCVSGC